VSGLGYYSRRGNGTSELNGIRVLVTGGEGRWLTERIGDVHGWLATHL
jgi:hypothetical protein